MDWPPHGTYPGMHSLFFMQFVYIQSDILWPIDFYTAVTLRILGSEGFAYARGSVCHNVIKTGHTKQSLNHNFSAPLPAGSE